MVVTGKVHPNRIITNCKAKPGDQLILTKAIGTGIVSTALKRGLVSDELRIEVTKQMAELNKKAAEIMIKYNVSACTDVTGFGLLGHLREMSKASKCDVSLLFSKVPFIKEAVDLAAAGVIPGGTYNNLEYVKQDVDFGSLPRTKQLLLCDAQTSGGLLISIDKSDAEECINEMKNAGMSSVAVVGEFTKKAHGSIFIKP